MENLSKWTLTENDKEKFISALTPELVLLRTKADISQEELAALIGVSRQTYGAIERKVRKMTWNTYLSLILFYDYNRKTHEMIRAIGVFPEEIVKHFNEGEEEENEVLFAGKSSMKEIVGDEMKHILECLDAQALNSIRTMVMVEYARCTQTPGEEVVKSFDGRTFSKVTDLQKNARKSLKNIKENQKHHA